MPDMVMAGMLTLIKKDQGKHLNYQGMVGYKIGGELYFKTRYNSNAD